MKNLSFLLLLLLVLESCKSEHNQPAISIKGSDSEKELVEAIAEKFMSENEVNVDVEGKGTNSGIEALIEGDADIANASRKILAEEIAEAEENNVFPYEHFFAQDAIAFIVDKSVMVDSLSLTQIEYIFTGKIKNWSEVGGVNRPIQVYGRNEKSGTHKFIKETVLKGSEYLAKIIEKESNKEIIRAVNEDDSGIGYVGSGYIRDELNENDQLKVLRIYIGTNKAYSPLKREDVILGNYPITRPFYQYTNGEPTGIIKSFIDFEFSDNGETIIQEMGYYPANIN